MKRYYCRVSTAEQKLDRQLVAYSDADALYIDRMSGKTKERPELQRMLQDLQPNDTVIVKSIDRLSRSTKDLLQLVDEISGKGAYLRILDMAIDTSTPQGQFFLTITGAFAELERKTLVERTKEGVLIAKSNGKYKGRAKGSIVLKGDALKRFHEFYKLGMSKSRLAAEFSVPRSTIYRWERILTERGEL